MVAHSIGVIAIQAGAGSRVITTQPAEARNALSAIEAISRETLASVRRTFGATATRAGVAVEVRWRGQRRPLPADIDLSAFRIIQEAVTVVRGH
jgi:signal transduction histidine kinase